MNINAAFAYVRRLAAGDSQAWKYLPYQAMMKLRGIDLTWMTVEQNGLTHERSHWHSNSGGPDLENLLCALPIKNSDAAVDLGCGKAGAMLTLARYPFSRVDGVEISLALAQTAVRNLDKLNVTKSRVFCADAADFTSLDSYTYIYMYNPFPEVVMKSVCTNIKASLLRRERVLTLIYRNPIYEPALFAAGFRKVMETEQRHADYPSFTVYRANEQ